jgi:hypothetical protein
MMMCMLWMCVGARACRHYQLSRQNEAGQGSCMYMPAAKADAVTVPALPQAFHEVFPHLKMAADVPKLVKTGDVDWDGVDAAFCCLPHATTQVASSDCGTPIAIEAEASMVCLTTPGAERLCRCPRPQEIISQLPRHIKVVDLSADFRLRDVDTYAEWCGAAF